MVGLPGAISARRPDVESISNDVVRGNGARLADATRLLDIGALRLVFHEIAPLVEAQRALDLVLARHVRGKIVLKLV